MKKKDNLAIVQILECAKEEFLEKGYEGASMRNIAERAGYTTGMLYGRFADKSRLFNELVQEGADKLFNYFKATEDNFAEFSPERQYREMYTYVDGKLDEMLDIIYDNFDAFKLIICTSAGSGYEYYVDKMIDVETANTIRFINCLREAGMKVNEVRADLSHMLSSAMFNGVFEVVEHELPREEARGYVKQIHSFFTAGWERILGIGQ